MADNPKPNGPRFTHQSTYLGFHGLCLCPEFSVRPCLWQIITDESLVPTSDWIPRLDENFADELVACRVRTLTLPHFR
jgi:hypothetical protein